MAKEITGARSTQSRLQGKTLPITSAAQISLGMREEVIGTLTGLTDAEVFKCCAGSLNT